MCVGALRCEVRGSYAELVEGEAGLNEARAEVWKHALHSLHQPRHVTFGHDTFARRALARTFTEKAHPLAA